MMPEHPPTTQPHPETVQDFRLHVIAQLPRVPWTRFSTARDGVFAAQAEHDGRCIEVTYRPSTLGEHWAVFVLPTTSLDEAIATAQALVAGAERRCSDCGALAEQLVDELSIHGPDGEVDLLAPGEGVCLACARARLEPVEQEASS